MDRTRHGGEGRGGGEGWLYFSQNGTAASTHWQTDNMTNCAEIRAGDLHLRCLGQSSMLESVVKGFVDSNTRLTPWDTA